MMMHDKQINGVICRNIMIENSVKQLSVNINKVKTVILKPITHPLRSPGAQILEGDQGSDALLILIIIGTRPHYPHLVGKCDRSQVR